MTLGTRAALPLLLAALPHLLALDARAGAQQAATVPAAAAPADTSRPAAGEPPPDSTAAVAPPDADPSRDERRDGYEVRSELASLLHRHPPELASVLALDPSLLANEGFVQGYPELARFLAAHPEVARSPRFYLAGFPVPGRGGFGDMVEMMTVFSVFLVGMLGLAWLVRTILEQKRWSRLTRTQSEVHNKILERFGTSEALLEYMRSPAGTKFLESAPIPLRSEAAAPIAPVSRALWSIQLGLVVGAGALGMLLVSARVDREVAEGFFALGAIGLCVGAGFVVSAVVSLVLSRRLGLWEPPPRAEALEEPGVGR